jgi:hypothetical protein
VHVNKDQAAPAASQRQDGGESGADPGALKLAAANAVSTSGSVLNVIAFLTEIYTTTRHPLTVGLAVLVNFLPVTILAPFISRWIRGMAPRRSGLILALAEAGAAAGMAVISAGGPLVMLYVGAGLLGVLGLVVRLIILSALPRLVAAKRLTRANVTLQISSQAGAVAGAAGLAVAGHAPIWILFAVDAVTFVIQAFLLWLVLPAQPAAPAAAGEGGAGTPGRVAVPGLMRYLVLLPSGFIALNSINVVLPLLMLGTLGTGQRGFALAEVVYPAAAITAGVVARRADRLPIPPFIGVLGAGWLVLAVAPGLLAALAGTAVLSVGVIASNAATQAWVQHDVPAAALMPVQSLAAAFGATVSTVFVICLSTGFGYGKGRLAMACTGIAFALAAAISGRLVRGRGGRAR